MPVVRTLIAALALILTGLMAPPVAAAEHGDFRLIGHRGYDRHTTENSLTALRAAAAKGATAVETDVRLTGDEQYAIMHDPRLNRTVQRCEGWWVHEKPKRKIRKRCRLNNGERVPMLSRYLREAHTHDLNVVIELKADRGGRWDTDHLATIGALVDARGLTGRVTFLSFEADLLDLAHQATPSIPTVWIARDWPGVDVAAENGDGVSVHARDLNKQRVADLEAAGLTVYGRNTNKAARWAEYHAYGVRRVLTDAVPRYARWLAARAS